MSEAGVDLSQIRGDWKFHIDYVTNAITQTLKRQKRLLGELDKDVRSAQVDAAVEKQQELWSRILKGSNKKGTIPTADDIIEEFIVACRTSRAVCDGVQDNSDSLTVEEFSEACRQARGLCDDLEMMREQRPADT